MPTKHECLCLNSFLSVQQEADSLSKKEPSVNSKYCESFAKFRRQFYLV